MVKKRKAKNQTKKSLFYLLIIILLPVMIYAVKMVTDLRSRADSNANQYYAIFDGNSYLRLPYGSILNDISQDFTVEFKIKPTSIDNGWLYAYILHVRNDIDSEFFISMVDESNNQFSITTGIYNDDSRLLRSSPLVLNPVRPYHLAVVKKDLNYQLYIDGIKQDEITLSSQPSNLENTYVNLGAQIWIEPNGVYRPDAAYIGEIDELRFSNIARYQGNFSYPWNPFILDSNTTGLYHFQGNSFDETLNYNDGSAFGNLQYNIYPQVLPGGHCPRLNIQNYVNYYGSAYINNQLAPAGTVLRMYSPRHELVGCGIVSDNGIIRYTRAFGEPEMIDGMNYNEPVTFWLNNSLAYTEPNVVYWDNFTYQKVNVYIDRSNNILPTPTPTLIPTPKLILITSPVNKPGKRIIPTKIRKKINLLD